MNIEKRNHLSVASLLLDNSLLTPYRDLQTFLEPVSRILLVADFSSAPYFFFRAFFILTLLLLCNVLNYRSTAGINNVSNFT